MLLDSARIAVIGLGYVGLPVAVAFARQFPAVGFDAKAARVSELRARRDSTGEVDPMEVNAAPDRVFSIGNSRPVQLLRYIQVLEQCLGRKAIKEFKPLRPGDVPATVADTADLERAVGFRPTTPVEVGVARFVEWYSGCYRAS